MKDSIHVLVCWLIPLVCIAVYFQGGQADASEVTDELHKQLVEIEASGGIFVGNQKQDNAKKSTQGISIKNTGGIVIINQRNSDKDILDKVDKIK